MLAYEIFLLRLAYIILFQIVGPPQQVSSEHYLGNITV